MVRVGHKYVSGLILLFWVNPFAFVHADCFDFRVPPKKPLREMVHREHKKDSTAGGDLPGGAGAWGATRGDVARPVLEIYRAILDPFTIKDPEKSKVKVLEEHRPGFLALQDREIEIQPIPFIHIEWMEKWAFVLAEGKADQPKKIVISYEKTRGTSHIRNLCGSIVLNAIDGRSTDVFLYEQIDASGRSSKELIEGHLGTLETLRKPKNHNPR